MENELFMDRHMAYLLIVGMQTSWFDALSNKGFQIIHHEYYRLITGLFLHVNLLHFAVNALAISYLDIYIDQRIKAGVLFFYIFAWRDNCSHYF